MFATFIDKDGTVTDRGPLGSGSYIVSSNVLL